MDYHIKLDLFEGPLDLLLHLISKSKIRIEDVSITQITEQYLDYLNRLKTFDVEIASDFLIMAATLLQMKSQALLPDPSPLEDDEQTSKEDLIKRLIEYKKFKEASYSLKKREAIYSNIYYKLPEELIDGAERSQVNGIEGNSKDLLKIFAKLLNRGETLTPKERVYPILRQAITLEQKIQELRMLFFSYNECSFSQLFDRDQDRSNIVITFLALLEMLKANQVIIYQDGQFEDIFIRRAN